MAQNGTSDVPSSRIIFSLKIMTENPPWLTSRLRMLRIGFDRLLHSMAHTPTTCGSLTGSEVGGSLCGGIVFALLIAAISVNGKHHPAAGTGEAPCLFVACVARSTRRSLRGIGKHDVSPAFLLMMLGGFLPWAWRLHTPTPHTPRITSAGCGPR